MTGGRFVIRTAMAVNATGPWAQHLASQLLPGQTQARLTPSKGIHILTPALTRNFAIALSGKNEHAFILPWKGMSLIGTTDEEFSGDLRDTAPKVEEIDRLKHKVLRLLPSARSCFDTILGTFGGVRALPGKAGDTYRASREVAICDHKTDGMEGFHSVFGGKWTTARRIAETYLESITARFSKPLRSGDTRTTVIAGKVRHETTPERLQHAHDNEMAITPMTSCAGLAASRRAPLLLTRRSSRHGLRHAQLEPILGRRNIRLGGRNAHCSNLESGRRSRQGRKTLARLCHRTSKAAWATSPCLRPPSRKMLRDSLKTWPKKAVILLLQLVATAQLAKPRTDF